MKKILIITCLTLFFLTGLHSCKREIKKGLRFNSKSMLISIPSNSLPSTENGILKFNSQTQYFNYIRFLDSVCVQTDSLDTVSINSKYLEIEDMFSYTSLRKIRQQTFEIENEIGWDNLEQVPDKYYIIDKSTLSTLNHLGEVIVANDYYCQSDSFNYVKITNYSTSLIELFRSAKENLDIEVLLTDTNFKFFHKGGVEDVLVASQPSQYKTTADTLWKLAGNINRYSFGATTACTNNDHSYYLVGLKLTTAEGYNIMPPPNSTCDLFVDWGDGTSNTYVINPSLITANADVPAAQLSNNPKHNYTTNGVAKTVTVKIMAKMHYHSTYVVEKTITLYIPSYGCKWTEKCSSWIWTYSGDLKGAMRCRIQAEHQWLMQDKKYHAFTETYKWKSGKWRSRRMDGVYAKASFDLLNVALSCSLEWPEEKEAVAFNDDNAHARKTIYTQQTPYNAYSIIYSRHKFLYEGVWYALNLSMKACD